MTVSLVSETNFDVIVCIPVADWDSVNDMLDIIRDCIDAAGIGKHKIIPPTTSSFTGSESLHRPYFEVHFENEADREAFLFYYDRKRDPTINLTYEFCFSSDDQARTALQEFQSQLADLYLTENDVTITQQENTLSIEFHNRVALVATRHIIERYKKETSALNITDSLAPA